MFGRLNRFFSKSKSDADSANILSKEIILPNPTGLHARPAALIVKTAKSFPAKIELEHNGLVANLRSVVEVINLETKKGSKVTLNVSGEKSQEAFEALVALIESGAGDNCDPMAEQATEKNNSKIITIGLAAEDLATLKEDQCFKGVSVSDGLAIGNIFVMKQSDIEIQEKGLSQEEEKKQLTLAIEESVNEINTLIKSTKNETQKEILEAHVSLLEDPSLFEEACKLLVNNASAAFAWKQMIKAQKTKLLASSSEILAERANDIQDVGNRVLRSLTHQEATAVTLPDQCILLADNLTPSDTINLDKEKVLGFATVEGGATSHVAILARAMNLPALCAIPEQSLKTENGTQAIIDTKSSQVIINPSDDLIEKAQGLRAQLKDIENEAKKNAAEPAITQDGIKIEVVANVTSAEETDVAVANGAEGVGLLRTEILFVDSATEPTEEAQLEVYSAIAKACGKDKPLVLRTLDIGGDKPVPYINIGKEENPFLGVRGLRLCLSMKDMFRRQIRAVLRAAEHTKMHIMFPMVTNVSELLEAKAMIKEEKQKLGITTDIPVGIMIEVPAAALLAEHFAPHVDFFSVGTNDLTQYTLAMDRGHAALAKEADAFHPAVLQLIAKTCTAANNHGKWVGVCGGLASDLTATALLIGLGVKELSASGSSIPHVKSNVRGLNMADCQKLAQQALNADSAKTVREIISNF